MPCPSLPTPNNHGRVEAAHDPVTPGHVVVTSTRAVSSWFDLTPDEQCSLLALAAQVRQALIAAGTATSLHIGFHEALTATPRPVQIHVVPLPAQIWHVDDSAALRLALHDPRLITPRDEAFKLALIHHFEAPAYDRIDLLISFVMWSGVEVMATSFDQALSRGAKVRLLTSDYMDVTDPDALGRLLDRCHDFGKDNLEIRIFDASAKSFHPKAYLFSDSTGRYAPRAFVGSSNLSRSALAEGIEWNLAVQHFPPVHCEFEELWNAPKVLPLDLPWLAAYRARRRSPSPGKSSEALVAAGALLEPSPSEPTPTPVQQEALDELARLRQDGHRAALVVMATGLGKTYLAAFDSKTFKRVLFLAHRGEILRQARDAFRRVRPPSTRMTLAVDGDRDLEGDIVFASVQTLVRWLGHIREDAFDYVVVDEFHHAEAPTYRKVLAHLKPSFLLGLTATPERMDGADLVSLCDSNVLHVCDLVDGIRRGLLSPFHYRGVRDVVDYDGVPFHNGKFDEKALSKAVSTEERALLAYNEWKSSGATTFIGFCTDVDHADFMAEWFSERGVKAVSVHSGPTSAGRAESLERLRLGQIDVLFSVDMFNEGLDIPDVNGILMLRPTESPIIFLQQLGRGLRKRDGKILKVIDLAANHKSFLRKAVLLAEVIRQCHLNAAAAVKFLTSPIDLPQGLTLDLADIHDILETLAKRDGNDAFNAWANAWIEQYGTRPRALDAALDNHFGIGSWFKKLNDGHFLDEAERAAYTQNKDLIALVENLSRQNVFSLIGLRAYFHVEQTQLEHLAAYAHEMMLKSADLRAHLAGETSFDWLKPGDAQRTEFWRKKVFETSGKGLSAILQLADNQVSWRVPPPSHDVVRNLIDEVLDAKLWQLASTRTPIFRDGDGREIQSHFEVTPDEGAWRVTLEARGGTKGSEAQWNLHYDRGYHLLLQRLKKVDVKVIDAYVDSKAVQALPIARRRLLDDDRLPLDMTAVDDVEALRKNLSLAAARVRVSDNAKGSGNSQKRVTLRVSAPGFTSKTDLEHYLSFGYTRHEADNQLG